MKQKGFVLISFTAVLPIVLLFIIFCAGLALARLEVSRKLHICRTQALEIQEFYAKAANQLIKLNPKAVKLRVERLKAEHALKLALSTANPAAVNVAQLWLTKVKIQQSILRNKQLLILGGTQIQVYKKLWTLKNEVKKQRNKNKDATQIITSNTKLHLEPTPKNSASPSYLPVINFEKAQEINILITTNPNSWFLDYGREWLYFISEDRSFKVSNLRMKKNIQRISLECSATLTKKDSDKWYPTLKKAKF